MAKEPSLGHARADSAMNEIDPTTKTIITAQDFCSAVSSFASHDSFKALTEVLDLLPQREDQPERNLRVILGRKELDSGAFDTEVDTFAAERRKRERACDLVPDTMAAFERM